MDPSKSVGSSSFATQWMPFFRRGCWLSGCPIEATVHEKVEWTRGFTREELEDVSAEVEREAQHVDLQLE
ncbi:MAG: hypothetical protein EOO38_15815 [Cytophagaceae bacterium]|nr:MAG: hypothetical protein EOO38_15815 [Cytophagaceae bacterium]